MSEQLVRFITAFDDPCPGTYCRIALNNYEKVYLKKARVLAFEADFHPFQSGLIYRKDSHVVYVCTAGGAIVVGAMFSEDSIEITSLSAVAERSFSVSRDLEESLSSRVVFTPSGLRG